MIASLKSEEYIWFQRPEIGVKCTYVRDNWIVGYFEYGRCPEKNGDHDNLCQKRSEFGLKCLAFYALILF